METTKTELLTYRQVAELYGFRLGTLYALVHQNRIPHTRFGPKFVRFSRARLEEWIASKQVVPGDGR